MPDNTALATIEKEVEAFEPDMSSTAGLSESAGKAAIKAIAGGTVPHTSIYY